jgi:hypothetical protein
MTPATAATFCSCVYLLSALTNVHNERAQIIYKVYLFCKLSNITKIKQQHLNKNGK